MDDQWTPGLPPAEPYGPGYDANGYRKYGAGTPAQQAYAQINRFDTDDEVREKLGNATDTQLWALGRNSAPQPQRDWGQFLKWLLIFSVVVLSIWGWLVLDANRRASNGGMALHLVRLAMPDVQLEPPATYLNEPFPLIKGNTRHLGRPEAYRCLMDEECRRGLQKQGPEHVRMQFVDAQWFLVEKAFVKQSAAAAKDACFLPLLIPSPTPVRSARNFCRVVVVSTSAAALAQKWNSMLKSSVLLDVLELLEIPAL